MNLTELSREYEASAQLLRDRMRQLRLAIRSSSDPEEVWHLRRRIADKCTVNCCRKGVNIGPRSLSSGSTVLLNRGKAGEKL